MEQPFPAEGIIIAERLRAARLAAKKTQQEVAGGRFSKSYISAIERGKMTPSVPALDYLAGQLAVSRAYLLGETEPDQFILPVPSRQEQEQAKKAEAAQLLLAEAEQADPVTAVALWRAAAYLSPQVRPLTCAHLARLSLAQGALDEAAALLEEGRTAARASEDVSAEGHVVLVIAQLKEQQGDAAGAEQAYTEAMMLLEGDPFQDEARARYSQWLAAAGRYEDAVRLLQATARQPLPQ